MRIQLDLCGDSGRAEMRGMYSILSPEKQKAQPADPRSPSNAVRHQQYQQQQQRRSAAVPGGGRRKCRRVFRLRIRVCSRLHFLEKLREMCVRLVLGTAGGTAGGGRRSRCRNVCDSPPRKSDGQSGYPRSSYCDDAVAECIKFIKQTAAAAESRSIIC